MFIRICSVLFITKNVELPLSLLLVFEGPVLGPQKDQGPDWTGLIWDRTAVLVLP